MSEQNQKSERDIFMTADDCHHCGTNEDNKEQEHCDSESCDTEYRPDRPINIDDLSSTCTDESQKHEVEENDVPPEEAITVISETLENHEISEHEVTALLDEASRMCRICQTLDSLPRAAEDRNILIQPCRCTGSMSYIHIECWDRMNHRCTVCRYPEPRPQPTVTTTTDHIFEFLTQPAPPPARIDANLQLFQRLVPIVVQGMQLAMEPALQITRQKMEHQRYLVARFTTFFHSSRVDWLCSLFVLYIATIILGLIAGQYKQIMVLFDK